MDDDEEILASVVSRHSSAGTSSVDDVVVCSELDEMKAGRVWAHIHIKGKPMALVQQLALRDVDEATGVAHWRVKDDFEFIEVLQIKDAVIWSDTGSGVIRTLIPRDLY